MKNIYVLIRIDGSYDDVSTTLVRAYTDQKSAQADADLLIEMSQELQKRFSAWSVENSARIRKAWAPSGTAEERASIGAEQEEQRRVPGHVKLLDPEAFYDSDWDVVEIELVEGA